MSTTEETEANLQLSDDELKALADQVAPQLEPGTYGANMVLPRRAVLGVVGGTLSASALLGWGAGSVVGQENTVWNVGDPDNPANVYGEEGRFDTLNTDSASIADAEAVSPRHHVTTFDSEEVIIEPGDLDLLLNGPYTTVRIEGVYGGSTGAGTEIYARVNENTDSEYQETYIDSGVSESSSNDRWTLHQEGNDSGNGSESIPFELAVAGSVGNDPYAHIWQQTAGNGFDGGRGGLIRGQYNSLSTDVEHIRLFSDEASVRFRGSVYLSGLM